MIERLSQADLDSIAAVMQVHEFALARLRAQVREQITLYGDNRQRTIAGRLFEFKARGKKLEVRHAS